MEFVRQGYKEYYYLYDKAPEWLKVGGRLKTPPLGIRSSVPLGGIGAGSVQLRADGSFRDWQIWNNWHVLSMLPGSNNANFSTMELQNTFLACRVQQEGREPVGRILETRPATGLPAIEEVNYSGAFPVSWLNYSDSELPVKIALTAWSSFSPHNAKDSALPLFFIDFEVENITGKPVDVSIAFSMQNQLMEKWRRISNRYLKAIHLVGQPPNGRTSCTIATVGEGRTSFLTGWKTAQEFWDAFLSESSQVTRGRAPDILQYRCWDGAEHASIIQKVTVPPKGRAPIHMVFSWYSPYFLDERGNLRGHVYENWFLDSLDVASYGARRKESLLNGVTCWHRLCFDNTLPDWFKEALVNFPSHYFNTTWWLKDGRYLHLESWGCLNIEPMHVFLHASYIDSKLFPDLHQQMLEHASSEQHESGFMTQAGINAGLLLARGGGGKQLCSGMSYILMVFSVYRATGDRTFLQKHWPHVLKALDWYFSADENNDGLPDRGFTTFDATFFEEADTNCEAALLFITSLHAAAAMAEVVGKKEVGKTLTGRIAQARASAEKELWNGEYLVSHWGEPKREKRDFLYTFELLGAHAAEVLGLPPPVDVAKIDATLDAILRYNRRIRVGLINIVTPRKQRQGTIFPAAPGYVYSYEKGVWPAGSFYVAAMLAHRGRISEALELSRVTYDNLARNVADLWNIPDGLHSETGNPTINDHYTRQNILWTLPMALGGIRYDATVQHLEFCPRMKRRDMTFPLITTGALGRVSSEERGRRIFIEVWSGRLALARFTCYSRGFSNLKVIFNGKSLPTKTKQIQNGIIIEFVPQIDLIKKTKFVISFL